MLSIIFAMANYLGAFFMSELIRGRTGYLTLEGDHKYETLNVFWCGQADRKLIFDGCKKIIRLTEDNRFQYIFNSNRKLTGHWPQMESHLILDWFQQLSANGVRKILTLVQASAGAN